MWIPQSGYLKVHEGYLRLSLTPIFQSYLEREHSFTFLDLGSYITYKGKQWLVEPDHFKVFEVMLSHSWGTISSVQSLSHVQLFATPWIAACQASLSINNSRNSLRLVSIKSVMPSSHLILCHPLLLLPSVCPSRKDPDGSFPMSQLVASGGQSIGVSTSASVLPKNTQDWSP